MRSHVELNPDDAEDILRMLTALKAILSAGDLPERLFDTLEPAIGPEVIRYGNPLGVMYLNETVERHRQRLIEALGGGKNLLDPNLAR